MPYVGPQLEVYEECMRSVPAIVKNRVLQRPHDVFGIIDGLRRTANEKGVSDFWPIMCSAELAWIGNLFTSIAKTEEITVVQLCDRAIAASAEWVADAH